eukprot:CAMPEP_0169103706 /NCGR_PEP_ID=MMETSP1015-20121227/22860_1 /TAXON_ID=342587 /ORGANISM="Karlodinium micrum, Strain CCMP2283" /LENGTH=125 /DNA_ID=CAMNT_0009164925 /DNA_START=91 /DNA_END=469 /DNA_ORIENTATION=+
MAAESMLEDRARGMLHEPPHATSISISRQDLHASRQAPYLKNGALGTPPPLNLPPRHAYPDPKPPPPAPPQPGTPQPQPFLPRLPLKNDDVLPADFPIENSVSPPPPFSPPPPPPFPPTTSLPWL